MAACAAIAVLAAWYFGPCFTVAGTYYRDLGTGEIGSIELRRGMCFINGEQAGPYRVNYFTRTATVQTGSKFFPEWPVKLRWGRVYSPDLKGGWDEYGRTICPSPVPDGVPR